MFKSWRWGSCWYNSLIRMKKAQVCHLLHLARCQIVEQLKEKEKKYNSTICHSKQEVLSITYGISPSSREKLYFLLLNNILEQMAWKYLHLELCCENGRVATPF